MRTTDRFVLFFSDKDVFSNWYPCTFELAGQRFSCVEQAMMWAKAQAFGDAKVAAKIMAATHPREHKALGRQVAGYDDAHWKAMSRRVVYAACRAKFTQDPGLLQALMATGARQLVEASPHDTLWGIGLAEHNPRALDPNQWKGQNWLGQVLTRLRDDLRAAPTRQQAPPQTTPDSSPAPSMGRPPRLG